MSPARNVSSPSARSNDRRVDLVLDSALDPAGERRQPRLDQHLRQRGLHDLYEQVRVEEALDDRERVVPLLSAEVGSHDELDDCRRSLSGQLPELLLEKRPQQRMNLEDAMFRRHEEAEPMPLDERPFRLVLPSTESATAGATDDESDSWLSDQRTSGSAAW